MLAVTDNSVWFIYHWNVISAMGDSFAMIPSKISQITILLMIKSSRRKLLQHVIADYVQSCEKEEDIRSFRDFIR